MDLCVASSTPVGAVQIKHQLHWAKIKILVIGENFDNTSGYFSRNAPIYSPYSIANKRLNLIVICTNFRIESCPQLASLQPDVATTGVTIWPLVCYLNNIASI